MSEIEGPGVFNVAVVPANIGIETSTVGIVVVEYLDDASTYYAKRRDGIRRVRFAEEMPGDTDLQAVIDRTVEIARPLGPNTTVVFSKEGSLDTVIAWRDAYSRTRELARWPKAVSIQGDGYGLDSDNHETVGEDELIGKSLRRMVKGRLFAIEPQAAAVAAAAQSMVPDVSAIGRLKFGARKRTALGFALALALYPAFAPGHSGRRYVDGTGRAWDSKAQAVGRYGSAVDQPGVGHTTTVTSFD